MSARANSETRICAQKDDTAEDVQRLLSARFGARTNGGAKEQDLCLEAGWRSSTAGKVIHSKFERATTTSFLRGIPAVMSDQSTVCSRERLSHRRVVPGDGYDA